MPLLPLVPFIVGIFGLIGALGNQIDAITASINAVASQIKFMPGTILVGTINRIVPLDEGLAMASAMVAIRLTALVIRIILSFIPGR